MMKLHPEILERDGKKQFVILRYEEFEAVREALDDLEDLQELRRSKSIEGKLPGIPFAEVGRRLRTKSKPAI
jgi:hypothetical protein